MNTTAILITVGVGALVAAAGYMKYKLWQAERLARKLREKELAEQRAAMKKIIEDIKKRNIEKKEDYEKAKDSFNRRANKPYSRHNSSD